MDAQFGLEDQQNINQFSKLNAQLHELDSLITVQQSNIDALEDAGNELMLVDDEEVMFTLGEGFVMTPVPDAEEKVSTASEKEEAELAALREKKQAVEEKMDHLKKVLYGKFGRENINLEE
mmetsp:Transcript_15023/g.45371  ORF Transcript_15023/g.45371 Transcript_15023/m.45371 type:complete len:121 (-) Transcript_15023:4848-5210(-)